jgi:hypothetical protein
VALNFFNDVFLLHFALKTPQSVFEGLTLLQSNFRQTDTPPNPSGRTDYLLQGFDWKSSGRVKNIAEAGKQKRSSAANVRSRSADQPRG